jgi:DNA-binding GntR family transcriptional regulator
MNTKKHTGTSEAVYKQLKEQILHLELPPGSAISEIDTAAKYDVSRTPVRDAFKMLEGEGLLEIRPHIGTFVSLIDLNMISDILYMRDVLEQAVLRDLTASHDKSQEFRIRLILQNQRELLDSDLDPNELSRAFIISDNEFHDALYELAGKQNVMLCFREISSQYERFRTFLNRGGRDDLLRLYGDHAKIWECISHKDYNALSACISHHIYDGFNSSTEVVNKHPDFFHSIV